MSTSESFPLAFRSEQQIAGGREGQYIVGAMFTASHSREARRLAASCESLGVPHVIHQVPVIHRSIHPRGSQDLAFTKANFIHHLLETHRKPVLYLDADCEFVSSPDLVEQLVRSGCDFAIYNWLADEHTDTFVPVELGIGPDGPPIKNRFFRFFRSLDWYSTGQLVCSGCVQLYGNSDAARSLLAAWQHTIATFPGCADDGCLSFAFNNRENGLTGLKTHWLPKSYARISWWIYVKPVIDHRAHPQRSSNFSDIMDMDPTGRRGWYPDRTEFRKVDSLFPRDCIIDTERGVVGRIVGDQLVTIRTTDQTFWL